MKQIYLKIRLMLMFSIFSVCGIYAQTDVTGTITDDTNEPLIGASVLVRGTTIGAVTDFDGKFSLSAPNANSEIEISYTGYRTKILKLSEGTSNLKIILEDDVNQLDEIVVTGLATTVKRKNLANSVARVDAAELTGVTPQSTLDGALYGKFKGAEIKANSGAPGGGLSFKLRGTTSISGSSQPLIILDGVFIDNSSIPAGLNIVSAAASGGSTSNQDNPSNRLADINPYDIESVEILKGASTAAIYGSRASGGVVIITTKKGEAGKTKFNFSQSIGVTSQLNKLGIRDWTSEKVLASSFAGDIDAFNEAESTNTLRNYEDELYGNKGLLSTTNFSARGGNSKTQFFIGGTYKNDEGIVEGTGYKKASARINLSHRINDIFDFSITSNYINSSADRGFFNNDNSGTTMGVSFTSTPSWAQLLPNENGVYPSNPYAPSNFLETAALITNNESVSRFIGGGTATAKIFQKTNSTLKAVFRGGADSYTLNTTAIFPNSLQFQRDGAGLNGVSAQGFTENFNTNLSLFLVHNVFLASGPSLTTSAGVTQENFNRNTILGVASDMIGSQTNLDQAGSRNVIQDRIIQQDKGFFVQEELNFNDQFIATVGFRADKSSNNGDVNKLYYYPKANIAINLHNFDFWNASSPLNQFKLRAAYGESGNFANFGSKYTELNSTIVSGSAGVITPSLRGNDQIGPERQKELEFGFDVEFNNIFSLDATYYIKTVEDLLLNADLPTSSGFSSQVTNAAELENKGIELGLNLNIINTADLVWTSRFGWWKNQAEITKLDVPAFTTGGFADFLGNYMVKEGFNPNTIIGVGPDPTVTLNGDGPPTLQVFGNAEPDFQLSWSNRITYKAFELSFLWHWKQGGENINLSTLLFDLNETTHDFDDMTLDPDNVLTNGNYRLALLGSNTDPYVEDAGYIRLREIGFYYTVPKSLLQDKVDMKIGFSGNNLINIFDYNSYDPEVSNFGGGGLSSGVEVTPFPSSKRYDFHLILNF
jgi:TonB-dependent starch-binding outer membrane protein SusC